MCRGLRGPAERLRAARRGGGEGGNLFRAVWEACTALGLPRVVCETALSLARAARPRGAAGLAAVVYRAALVHAHPLYPREVSEFFGVDFGEVGRLAFRLAGAAGVRTRGRLDLSKAFLARILADLGAAVKPGAAVLASEIAVRALRLGVGARPLHLAAVAAYTACRAYNVDVTLEQVAGLTGVGEASLSRTARRMEVRVRIWV
jgi:transcription initiation factor TFIIIB Brf1 subunit/transcription initiation factor TFIIB